MTDSNRCSDCGGDGKCVVCSGHGTVSESLRFVRLKVESENARTNREKAQRIYSLFRDLRRYNEALADNDKMAAREIYFGNPDVRAYWNAIGDFHVKDTDVLIRMIEGIIGGE